jgi:hypothetical protein
VIRDAVRRETGKDRAGGGTVPPRKAAITEAEAIHLFRSIDTNADGTISMREWERYTLENNEFATHFQTWVAQDTDEDATISRDEFVKHHTAVS